MRIRSAVAATSLVTTIALAQSSDPRPQDASLAIVAAFGKYDVVGVDAGHNNKVLDDFLLTLVHRPELAGTVNDIATECGNSRYQAILDRYIAGEEIAVEQVRQVWRDSSVGMCGISGFYAALFPLVREINKGLPAAKRFRMLALEPPGDWTTVDASAVRRAGSDRNPSITSILTTEVLAKKRKALVLCGVGHLWHTDPSRGGTAVTAYERTYPGRTFVIDTHHGFAAFIDLERGHQLEARMQSWPRPSIVPIKGTWLADLDLPYFLWPFLKRTAGETFADKVDAYLYLGPADSLTWEPVPASLLDDGPYMTELVRRFDLNVDEIRRRNNETPLFTAADRQEARRFAPGAEFVGTYAETVGGPPLVEVDFRAGTLSARLPSSPGWVTLVDAGLPARYRADVQAQDVFLQFETANGSSAGVVLDRGAAQGKLTLRRLR